MERFVHSSSIAWKKKSFREKYYFRWREELKKKKMFFFQKFLTIKTLSHCKRFDMEYFPYNVLDHWFTGYDEKIEIYFK